LICGSLDLQLCSLSVYSRKTINIKEIKKIPNFFTIHQLVAHSGGEELVFLAWHATHHAYFAVFDQSSDFPQ